MGTFHLLEEKQSLSVKYVLAGFPGWSCLQPKMAKEDTSSGCSLASRGLRAIASLIQRRPEFMCCVLEAIGSDLLF